MSFSIQALTLQKLAQSLVCLNSCSTESDALICAERLGLEEDTDTGFHPVLFSLPPSGVSGLPGAGWSGWFGISYIPPLVGFPFSFLYSDKLILT